MKQEITKPRTETVTITSVPFHSELEPSVHEEMHVSFCSVIGLQSAVCLFSNILAVLQVITTLYSNSTEKKTSDHLWVQ